MLRMAQFPIDNDLWFDFKLECQRRSRKIPDVLGEMIQAQLDTWRDEQAATAAAVVTHADVLP